MRFVRIVNPGGPGWMKYKQKNSTEDWSVPKGILSMLLGSISVYAILLGTGSFVYGNHLVGTGLIITSLICTYFLFAVWFKTEQKET